MAAKTSKGSRTITTTKNYRLFKLSKDNRPLDLKKHRWLKASMMEYGWLRTFPMSCVRNGVGLVVKDGQHRLAIAEELGIPVHYAIEDVDYDIAKVNRGQEKWSLMNYAQMYAAKGIDDYQRGIDLHKQYKIPIGMAFALLRGTTTFSNFDNAFREGRFVVTDSEWADSVASLYASLTNLSSAIKNARLIEACMAVCRIDCFDASRLIRGAERCRDKLIAYSTRDAYLEMLESLYNFGRKQLFPLKISAVQAMRDRNAVKAAKDDAKE